MIHNNVKPNIICIIRALNKRILEHSSVLQAKEKKKVGLLDVSWEKPPSGMIKINTDPALMDNAFALALVTPDLYVFLGQRKYELQILLWLKQQLSFGPSKLQNFTSSYISSLKAMQRFVLMRYLLSNKIFLGLLSSIVMISLIFLINLLVVFLSGLEGEQIQ